jgi:hypothetical protein
MKNKIVGILVCILILATAVPAVTSGENNSKDATIPNIFQINTMGYWTQKQKLLASDGAANDNFGLWVDYDGDTALIGAWNDDDNGVDSGSAYVFIWTGTTWTQQAKLLASDGQAGDSFGSSVSISGDTALIGARWDDDNGNKAGSAYVFIRTGTTWTQQAKILPADAEAEDRFGGSVSLDGDTAVISAWFDNDNGNGSGSAYVFIRTGTTWTQQAKLLASDGQEGDDFGDASVCGDTALIGAALDDDNGVDSGSAYIFVRTGTTWTQQAKLLASDGQAGDQFSRWAVSLDGDTALIGSEADDDNGIDSGSAYVFTRTGTTWIQQAKLLASDGAANDYFGNSISISGDTALIGAEGDDDKGTNAGSAYVFTRTGTTWIQQAKLFASDGTAGDQFGYPVILSGDTAFITATYDDDNGANSGSVYVFVNQNEPPVEVPVWEKGDSWTYNELYLNHMYKADGTLWYQWYHNCTSIYTVTDTPGDKYTVTMTSTNNEGRVTIGSIHLKFTKSTKFTREFILRKSDLALVSDSWQEKGLVFWLLGNIIPLPAQYTDVWEGTYTPPDVMLPFPLSVGIHGTLPNATYSGYEKCTLYWGLITLYNWPVVLGYTGEQNYTCKMAPITVPAGNYDTYNVSLEATYGLGQSIRWSYYAPEVGWIVKQTIDSDQDPSGHPGFIFDCELVSTTYTP